MPKDPADSTPGSSAPGVGERVLTNLAYSSRLLSSCTQSNSLDDLGYSVDSRKQDCLKLIRDLNRELSFYHTTLLHLNLRSDCDKIQDDLKRSRRKALDMVHVLKSKLPARALRPTNQHQLEVEKMWCLYVSCIDSLHLEMSKTVTLQDMLLIHADSSSLMNLCIDDMDIHIAEQLESLSLDSNLERLLLRKEEIAQLEKEVFDVKELLKEFHDIVDIRPPSADSTDSVNLSDGCGDKLPASIPLLDNNLHVCSFPLGHRPWRVHRIPLLTIVFKVHLHVHF